MEPANLVLKETRQIYKSTFQGVGGTCQTTSGQHTAPLQVPNCIFCTPFLKNISLFSRIFFFRKFCSYVWLVFMRGYEDFLTVLRMMRIITFGHMRGIIF